MRIFKLSAVFIAAMLFIFGCAGRGPAPLSNANGGVNNAAVPDQPPADDLAASRKLYKTTCARCHQENGEGGEVNIEGDTFKAPSFKRPGMIKAPDSDLIKGITNGGDDMPAFKERLTPEQIKDLVRFIRREFQSQPSDFPR
jgi:mono/diheme cytochrome c family protein